MIAWRLHRRSTPVYRVMPDAGCLVCVWSMNVSMSYTDFVYALIALSLSRDTVFKVFSYLFMYKVVLMTAAARALSIRKLDSVSIKAVWLSVEFDASCWVNSCFLLVIKSIWEKLFLNLFFALLMHARMLAYWGFILRVAIFCFNIQDILNARIAERVTTFRYKWYIFSIILKLGQTDRTLSHYLIIKWPLNSL